jgi:hypothetical protein
VPLALGILADQARVAANASRFAHGRGGAVTDERPSNPYAYAGCEDLTLGGPDDFALAITSCDERAINFCLYEARKRKILVPLFKRLIKQTAPSMQTREAFHRAWSVQGLYFREDFAVDPLLPDVLRNFLPGYSGAPVELFRGERGSNHEARRCASASGMESGSPGPGHGCFP